jgi:hypothetical protein
LGRAGEWVSDADEVCGVKTKTLTAHFLFVYALLFSAGNAAADEVAFSLPKRSFNCLTADESQQRALIKFNSDKDGFFANFWPISIRNLQKKTMRFNLEDLNQIPTIPEDDAKSGSKMLIGILFSSSTYDGVEYRLNGIHVMTPGQPFVEWLPNLEFGNSKVSLICRILPLQHGKKK